MVMSTQEFDRKYANDTRPVTLANGRVVEMTAAEIEFASALATWSRRSIRPFQTPGLENLARHCEAIEHSDTIATPEA